VRVREAFVYLLNLLFGWPKQEAAQLSHLLFAVGRFGRLWSSSFFFDEGL